MLTAKQPTFRVPVFQIGFSSAWLTSFFLWHVLAIVLLIRRVAGELVQPLSGWELFGVLMLVVTVSSLFRISAGWLGMTIGCQRDKREHATRSRVSNALFQSAQRLTQWLTLLLTFAGLMILGSISIAGSSRFMIVVTWGLWVALETAWLVRVFAKRPVTPRRAAAESTNSTPVSVAMNSRRSIGPTETESNQVLDVNDGSLPAGVTQQLIRSQHGQVESLHGLVRVEFPVGEQTQFIHIAFCPPFEHLPDVHVGQVSGPSVSVKLTQVESFGMRIEVRRNRTELEQLSIVLEIEATALEG